MSNLSFARIMYGYNEVSSTSVWKYSPSQQSQFPNSLSVDAGFSHNWFHRFLSAVTLHRDGTAAGSSSDHS